jgi:hypothetical protein
MMGLFNRPKKKICFIKTVEITKEGWETRYHTEVDDCYVSNSMFYCKETAEAFYETVLSRLGVTKVRETLRKEYR